MKELIRLTPVPKEERDLIIKSVRDAILDGTTNPLEAFIALKGLAEMAEEIMKAIRYYVDAEAMKYPEKKFTIACAEVTKSERRTYDFGTANDSLWGTLKATETKASDDRKEREKFLKSIPVEGVITPDGEFLSAPAFTTADVLAIKIL